MATVKGFRVGSDTLKYQDSFIADEFSESKSYSVGDHVFYDGQLYKCKSNAAAGQWTGSTNWVQAVIGNDVSNFTE